MFAPSVALASPTSGAPQVGALGTAALAALTSAESVGREAALGLCGWNVWRMGGRQHWGCAAGMSGTWERVYVMSAMLSKNKSFCKIIKLTT